MHMVRFRPLVAGLAVAVAVVACVRAASVSVPAPAPVPTAAAACEFDNVERIVAVGDVHGAYGRFLQILRAAEVIDADNRWIGGKTRLVQTGDVVDRGPDSKLVLEFLRKLTKEASAAGGAVHALIGNHEAMRLLRDYRYVDPGEYAAFITHDSVQIRRLAVENAPPAQRATVEAETPLGMVEMLRAFRPDQDLGRYIRSLDTVVRINGVLFLHGGISPAVASKSCATINDTVRRELGRDLEKTSAAPEKSLSAGVDGPLWYRGLALEKEDFAPEVDKILAAQGAHAVVIGHSADPGAIRSRFNNKVFLIDTGMQPAYLPSGRASALEIKGDVFTAIYLDGRQVLRGGGE